MVDRAVLSEKADAILHHVGRIRSRLPIAPQRLAEDEDFRNIVYFDLVQAIQACVDLAVHVCTHESLGMPEGPAAAFALLADKGLVPTELSVRLAGASGLRNLIVHRYGRIDHGRVAAELASGLGDLEAFVRAMHRHVGG